jgi:hypothetical protein
MPVDSYSPGRSIRLTRPAILLTATVLAALLLLPHASALAGEVHFDAESPAGKEYALPLDQAREEAAGAGKTDGPAGERAPLFGEGVSSGGGTGGSGGGSGNGPGPNAPPGGGDSQGHGSQADRSPAAIAAAISKSDSSYSLSSAILWIVAIIALAGLAALALRTLQRPRAT